MLHIHKWKIVSAAQRSTYEFSWDELPTKIFTDVAMRCTVCGTLKTKRLQGHHELDDLVSEGSDGRRVISD